MNRDELRKLDGRVVRIRPPAQQFGWDGADLGEVDHRWRVTVTGGDSLELEHVKPAPVVGERELLTFRLNHDHIKSYASDPNSPGDGFLLLVSEVQIQFDGPKPGKGTVRVEPIHPLPKVGTRRPGPTSIYNLASARVAARQKALNDEMVDAILGPRPHHVSAPLPDGFSMAGVRELVGEADFPRLKRIAEENAPHLVSLQWQAPECPDLQDQLRDVIGTIFRLETLGHGTVARLHEDDVDRYFHSTLTAMRDSGFRLWLDHGHASKLVGRSTHGIQRIESDRRYHLQFRVRPEGKPVGAD